MKALFHPTIVCLFLGTVLLAPPSQGADKPPVVAFTDMAPKTWMLREAKEGVKFLQDKKFTITELPKEMEGGTLLVRDRNSHASWVAPGMLTAREDVTVYVTFLWKWKGKEQLSEPTLAKFADEGWTDAKAKVDSTFPAGEDWVLKTYKKSQKKGAVNLQLRMLAWPEKTLTFFVFK